MSKHISDERKGVYYLGMGLVIIGVLLFASTFVTFIANFGNFGNFAENAKSDMIRAFGGMALIIIGGIIQQVAARGLAGSGVVLDPEKARRELEPYSRMAGGMVRDALEETGITARRPPEKIVMIKCPACGKLNEEDSKFCRECGKPL